MNNTSNQTQIELWNTILFEKFRRFRLALSDGLSGLSDEVLRRRPYPPGARVLDVGCGFGDTTRRIANQVGQSGAAIGVDFAPNFIGMAEQETAAAGIGNASFFVADVEADDVRGPYDHVFSRFGTMFFSAPEAALRNVRRALKPGTDFTMVVWRRREANPWVHEPEVLMREILALVPAQQADGTQYKPGPFSLADADFVSELLRRSGFDCIRFERLDTDVCIGRTLDEAIEIATAMGPGGEMIRLAGEEGAKRKPAIGEALRALFTPYVRADGVWLGSSSWIVTAQNPGT